MLILNISYHCRMRGHNNPAKYLRQNGFSNHLSHKLTNNTQTTIPLKQLEELCELFQCTPNDIIEWIPDEVDAEDKTHHLISLKKDKEEPSLLQDLTYEQLKKIAAIVREKK